LTVLAAPIAGEQSRNKLVELEGQTTLLTGPDLPRRVLLDADAKAIGLEIAFKSDTAPTFDVWNAVKHVPLSAGTVWRRDHSVAHMVYVGVLQRIRAAETPVDDVDDRDLAFHAVTRDLLFRTMLDQWQSLVADRVLQAYVTSEATPGDASTSEAWRAFEELGEWLDFSHGETSDLLGLGKKTAYGWRREGHPPQARLARRLYQAHALVRQLVLALGKAEAQTMLARGGDDSALALINDNRVAEAEARFADLLYTRSRDNESPLGASRSGDEDVIAAIRSAPERLPGGRRRVQIKRGR
jgi:hypothetical protein